jgi:hypothetical protein
MPWLGEVQGVLENWYAGQEVGNTVAALLFGDVNPSGKLPVTFPASLADVPAHTTAQWPDDGSTVQYSEGLKVGYRWCDVQNITPLYPFGFGLSYTTFSFSGLQVGALDASGNATVSATVTNTGSRAGAEIAQLYVGDPASTGEPAKQLKGFQRVDLQPGASQTLHFTVTAHDLAHWSDSAGGWTTTAGSYQIMVGDSSRNLPLTGTLAVSGTLSAKALTGSGSSGGSRSGVTVTNPHGMSSRAHAAVQLRIAGHTTTAGSALAFTATGLPAGLSISHSGVISGTATSTATRTVHVTATDSGGATDTASFVWTVSRARGPHSAADEEGQERTDVADRVPGERDAVQALADDGEVAVGLGQGGGVAAGLLDEGCGVEEGGGVQGGRRGEAPGGRTGGGQGSAPRPGAVWRPRCGRCPILRDGQRRPRHLLPRPGALRRPHIGCGLAGGRWERIEPLVLARLTEQGTAVTVYDHD